MFGLDAPALATDAQADAPSPDDASIDAATYRASAVRFTGATYLSYGALAGVVDSPRGMLSVWLRFNGNDNHQQLITAAELGVGNFGGIGGIARQASNRLEIADRDRARHPRSGDPRRGACDRRCGNQSTVSPRDEGARGGGVVLRA